LRHLRIETQIRWNLINHVWIWWLPIFYLLKKRHTNNLKKNK
jgi:hypothetical protein